jgi:integrase
MPRKKKIKLPPYVVLKHGGEWHVRLSFKTKLRDDKGRIVYEQTTRRCVPETAERAAEIVAALRSQYQAVQIAPTESQTLDQFLQAFLESKKLTITLRTYEDYESLFDRYINGTDIASRMIESLRPRDVQKFYAELSARGVSPSMIRKVHVLLSMAFKRAVLWDELPKNPCDDVMLPAVVLQESLAMTQDEARRFIVACRSDPEFFIFEFGLMTGLRPQELLAVRWGDIDFKTKTVKIRQAIAFTSRGAEIKTPKTKTSVRTVSFDDRIHARLIEHKTLYEAHLAELRLKSEDRNVFLRDKGVNYRKRKAVRRHARERLERHIETDLVFPASTGGPMSLHNLGRRAFDRVLKKAKIDGNYSV